MYVGAYPPGCIRDSSSYQRITKNPSLCRKDDTHFCLENPRSNTWNSKNRTIVFWCAVQKWCAQWRETRFSFCGLTHIFCTHLDHECIWFCKNSPLNWLEFGPMTYFSKFLAGLPDQSADFARYFKNLVEIVLIFGLMVGSRIKVESLKSVPGTLILLNLMYLKAF